MSISTTHTLPPDYDAWRTGYDEYERRLEATDRLMEARAAIYDLVKDARDSIDEAVHQIGEEDSELFSLAASLHAWCDKVRKGE